MRLGTLLVAIGPWVLLPQPGRCQAGAADANGRWLAAARDGALRTRCEDALAASDRESLWRLARAGGPGVSAPLWRLLGEAGKDEARWRLLVAIVAAGGAAEDSELLRWASAQGRSARDRAFVALLLALGPRRLGGAASEAFDALRGPSDFAVITAACAAARFPRDNAFEGVATNDSSVAAALAFAGASQAARATPPPRGDRRESLWWRGVFLRSAAQGASALVRERAMALRAGGGPDAAPLRAAAWRCAAIAGDVTSEGERPEPSVLEALAADARTLARFRGWFDGAVGPRNDVPERLAVAHVLAAAPADAVAAAVSWRGNDAVEAHVALALAWRIAVGEVSDAQGVGDGVWAPVAVARRQTVAFDAITDEPLRAALTLRAAGRLDDPAFAAALEAACWRRGSHPSLAVWRLERTFVRDLVLAGSQAGAGKYQPHVPPEQRNQPEGIGATDPWFEAAVAAYEFLEPATLPLPIDARLPR